MHRKQNQVLEAATFLEASGWRACRTTRGLLMHSVYELLPRHFSSDETDCWNCGRQKRVFSHCKAEHSEDTWWKSIGWHLSPRSVFTRSAARPTGLAVCLVSEGANKRRGAITTLITRITLLSLTPWTAVTPRQPACLHSRWLKKKTTTTKNPQWPWSPERQPPLHGSVFIFIHHIQWAQPLLLCQPAVGQHLTINDHVDIKTDQDGFPPSGMHLGNVACFSTVVLSLMTCETWELVTKKQTKASGSKTKTAEQYRQAVGRQIM